MTGFLPNVSSAQTGNWVSDRTQFFLVDRQGKAKAQATACVNCTEQEARITATPNPPTACNSNGNLAKTEVQWNAPGQTNMSVRLNTLTGSDLTGPRSSAGSAVTGEWANNGMIFILRALNGVERVT